MCGLGNVEADDFQQTTPPDSELLTSVPIREEINGSAVKKSDTSHCSKSVCVLVALFNDTFKFFYVYDFCWLLDLLLLQVLHPCSRPKIFKNTGSFSYKRLLPYLMQASDGNCLVLCIKIEN